MTMTPVGMGDRVREPGGRHVGRVCAVEGATVRVEWEETGWLSDHDAWELERVRRWRPELGRHADDDE